MTREDYAGEFARAERNQDSATRLHPMTQRFGQRVGKRLIERDGQADVTVEKGTRGHEHFQDTVSQTFNFFI
jgi:hypothetical protein